MPVYVTRNFGQLTEALKTTKDDWYQIGLLARERILQRTRSGQDQYNKPFTPYSQGYIDARTKEGLARNTVKLELSGEMLRSIQIIATDTQVTLTF